MALRLNLESRFLMLLAGGMSLILILSTYLHDVSTALVIEDDRYNTAISETAGIANRIFNLHLLDAPEALQRDIDIAANDRRAFEQIDVYQQRADGPQLLATTASGAERLPALNDRSLDNDLHEMEHPVPGVVTMEVVRHGLRYWVISIRNAADGVTVTTLAAKTGYSSLARRRALSDDMLLAGTIAICVGLFWLLFVRFFRRPARDLAYLMQTARGGALEARATVDRDDELGDIAQRFNAMMDDLAARHREREALLAEISGFNDRLRAEVERAVTALRARSDELYQSQQKLARVERLAALGYLAAGLAHEIGTPLNAVSGHLQLLARRHVGDEETQRRIDVIREQINLIVQSVRALLRRTKKRHLVMRDLDMNALVRGVLLLAEPMLDAHAVEVTARLAPSLPPVRADHDSLHQVLLNLVNNSIDAMPGGGRLMVRTDVDAAGPSAIVAVQDSGVGIRDEEREHLFEPAWTTKPTGSGFGLAIAREIVEAHDGRIDVESLPGAGTTFQLRLPLAVAGAAATRSLW